MLCLPIRRQQADRGLSEGAMLDSLSKFVGHQNSFALIDLYLWHPKMYSEADINFGFGYQYYRHLLHKPKSEQAHKYYNGPTNLGRQKCLAYCTLRVVLHICKEKNTLWDWAWVQWFGSGNYMSST